MPNKSGKRAQGQASGYQLLKDQIAGLQKQLQEEQATSQGRYERLYDLWGRYEVLRDENEMVRTLKAEIEALREDNALEVANRQDIINAEVKQEVTRLMCLWHSNCISPAAVADND